MSFINSKNPSWEIALRGRYDVKTCLQNADKWFWLFPISNSKQNIFFNVYSWEINDMSSDYSNYNNFFNLKDKGLFELNSNKHKDINNCPFELSTDYFDFKVIRTPISNRTFVIGGIDHSLIKEIKASNKDISVILVFLSSNLLFEFRLYKIM